MLSAKNIQKKYGALQVLRGVDVDVEKGEVVCIVGASGSGKSTLLHILGTLDKADAGTININGTNIAQQNDNLKPVTWHVRLLNYLIDNLVIFILLLLIFGWEYLLYNIDDVKTLAKIALIIFSYYFITELFLGVSLAKFITGCKIFSTDGSAAKPSALAIFYRTLARFIPLDNFSFLSSTPIGWHDSVSKTVVAKSNTVRSHTLQKSLSAKQLAMFRNKSIGFVFQFHHLLPEFTALENVCIPGWIAGRPKQEVIKRAKELLTMLGLVNRMENKPQQLSGGEQQRVAVARALINNPNIVMADEPTGNLDSANAKELHQLFIDLRNKFNQTFLIVTHNEDLAKLCDRVVVMKDGNIVASSNYKN
jgi:lipoprotein-releasing system ATP-binding protein